MRKVIILNGMSCCGKDTFVDMVREYFYSLNKDVIIDHYSTVIWTKNVAKMLGWDGKKTTKSRDFLHGLKTLCDNFNDMSFRDTENHLVQLDNMCSNYICFIDIREPENIAKFCKALNAISVYIDRDNEADGGSGDDGIKDYVYDVVIDNNGTLDHLKEAAEVFCNYLQAEYFSAV